MGQDTRGSGLKPMYFLQRREEKYEMQVGAAAFLREEIERHLPRFEFRKGHPYTYITTIYFDSEKLEFYDRAKSFYDDNIKIRVKEYYYQNTSFPRPGLIHKGKIPWVTFESCFVEIKQRIRGLVVKRRFEVPKSIFGRLIRGDDVWDDLVASKTGIEGDGLFDTYREFRDFLRHHHLSEKSIINYRRSVYQEDELELRITFDDEIATFRPVPGLYESVTNLARDNLGSPYEISEKVILEIKCKDGYPPWLVNLLHTHQPKRISKFTTSMRVLTHEFPRPVSGDDATASMEGDGNGTGDTTQISDIER
jgi:hypothetical protein